MTDFYPHDRERLYLEMAVDLKVPPEAVAANDVLSAYHELLEFSKMLMRDPDKITPEAGRFRRRKLREQLGQLGETVQVLKKLLKERSEVAVIEGD